MTDPYSAPNDPASDDALVARLYDLARTDDSNGELARIDAIVYERLLKAYSDDTPPPA